MTPTENGSVDVERISFLEQWEDDLGFMPYHYARNCGAAIDVAESLRGASFEEGEKVWLQLECGHIPQDVILGRVRGDKVLELFQDERFLLFLDNAEERLGRASEALGDGCLCTEAQIPSVRQEGLVHGCHDDGLESWFRRMVTSLTVLKLLSRGFDGRQWPEGDYASMKLRELRNRHAKLCNELGQRDFVREKRRRLSLPG